MLMLFCVAGEVYAQNKTAEKDTTLITVLPDSLFDTRIFKKQSQSAFLNPFTKQRSGLTQLKNAQPKTDITFNDSTGFYEMKQTVDGVPFGQPIKLDLRAFSELSFEAYKRDNLQKITYLENNRRTNQQGLMDFKFTVPGGKQSVFTTIFGKPEVNLRVTGTANMNIGASIQRDENPAIPEDQRQRVDPTFDQNLKLNIQGSIGDKLTINTDWDTERPFDYQNRLKIMYQGYDDEIIKSVELGNVGMETGNSLISGGQALFGIKSVAQMGAFKLTSVLSQKEGQGNSKSIDGGSTEESFKINPTDYEDARHFYLDFYTYENYDRALANPNLTQVLYNINQIVVYKLNIGTQRSEDFIQGLAFADLGVTQNGITNEYEVPNALTDNLDDAYLEELKQATLDTIDVENLANRFQISSQNIVKGYWVKLEAGVDFDYDSKLGTISLKNSTLQSNEALAVAFTHQVGNSIIRVGDVSRLGEEIQILKLIRQQNLTKDSKTWPLTMRNVYSIGSSGFSSADIEFNLVFTGLNTDQNNIPGTTNNLINDLGLDRVNISGEAIPDNLIDFSTGVLDGVNGKIYFPYREPFGERIIEVIQNSNITDKETAIQAWAFPELYQKLQSLVKTESKTNLYSMNGKIKGGTSGSFYLGYSVVEGSVKVLANGVELQEGLDYEVDYSIGNVYITNQRYLAKGQQIKIDFESNNILQIQQTTFTGLRGEYAVNDNIKFGATFFNLKDRPLTDKIRIGDEPINNSVYGFDAKANFDAPWLTKALDWLPLIETKAASSVTFSGEFAQLKPGVAQTNAVQSAIDSGRLYPDEERGVSFIDEFEGSKTSFSFNSPSRWSLAAAPASIPGYDFSMENPSTTTLSKMDRSDMRSQFSWYSIPINAASILNVPRNRETRLIQVEDVFERQTLQQDNFLTTMDLFYNPRARGVYNYNLNLKNLLEQNPEDTWGGMTTILPQGLENLTLNNIEFVEFWVQAIVPDSIYTMGSSPSVNLINDYDGKLYLDLGLISEDVIPNGLSNNEDGLSQGGVQNIKEDQEGTGLNSRSLVLSRAVDFDGQFSINSIEDEDIGLDGLPNEPNFRDTTEVQFFAEFVESIRAQYGEGSQMYQDVLLDASNDDYYYWAESQLEGKTMQERFLRMFGYTEMNSRTTGEKRAITNRPDAEGLLITTVPKYTNGYFQYEIDLNPVLQSEFSGSEYVTDVTNDRNDPGQWFQVRIPINEFKRKVGEIVDFQAITHMRLWMSGYRRPFTLRFASFELVGSQWRKAEEIGNTANLSTEFFVSTINVEENRSRRPVPYVSPAGAIRAINRTQQGNVLANEQSLSMEVNDLRSGDLRMIRRNFTGGMNMINYSNLRMFVHAEGFNRRGEAELIVRLGRDLERNYYEYRQPLTPTDTTYFSALPRDYDTSLQTEIEERVWLPDENAMNIVLSSFNALKQLRNLQGADASVTFYDSTLVSVDSPKGTRIGIKGNPSLQDISEIGIGVMNPAKLNADGSLNLNTLKPSLDAIVWVNELRVSGFDNEDGWAANTSAQIRLADIGSVSGKFLTSTSGFGSLDSRLGNRLRADRYQYDISTSFNAHKLIPEKYGWNIPLGFSYSQSVSTPQFLPRDGDIRLSDYKDAVRAQNIPTATQDSIINAKVNEIQDYSNRKSFTLSNFSKKNSKSKILQYTLDNINLNYSYSEDNKHSVQTEYQKNWAFNSGLNYSYSWRKVDLLRPFWFVKDVPYVGFLHELQLGYMPTSINLSGTLSRNYNESLQRSFDETIQPVRQSHQFDFSQNFGFAYNLTPTIPISFNTSSKYVLNNAGERRFSDNLLDQYEVIPTFEAINNLFTVDSVRARHETYTENYGASWRPQINKIKWLNWFTYTTTFRGGFGWKNSQQNSNLGASINNSYQLNNSASIKIQDLLKKIPFYDNQRKADEKEARERTRIESAIKRRKQQEEKIKEQQLKNPNYKPPAQNQAKQEDEVPAESNLLYYGRKTGLALFSIQNIDLGYNHSENSSQSGYSGGSSFFDAFSNPNSGSSFSPPLLYRIGLMRSLNQVIANPNADARIQLSVSESRNDNFTISSKFQPFKNFNIDLDWNVSWNSTTSKVNTLAESSDEIVQSIFNEGGTMNTSSWVFGGNFETFYRKQLQRGLDDYSVVAGKGVMNDATGNNDGLTILDRDAVHKDITTTYLAFGNGSFGKNGYLPLPLPNWKINWSGLETMFEFASDYISRISLSHSYSGGYRVDWAYNRDLEEPRTFALYQQSGIQVTSKAQSYEPTTVNIDQKFIPMVALNLTWKNNVSTRLQYDYSKIVSFSTSSSTMNESSSQGFKFTGSWSKRGFRLPFFRKLRNTLDLSLSAGYYDDTKQRRILLDYFVYGLENGINSTNAGDYEYVDNSEGTITGDSRINFSSIIGYQFSSMVKANFEYTYNHTIPKSTQSFERVTQNIKFNIIVSIRSN
ncbi:cell surface protein SprA [bacterium]|nr:MAG: cell surface protein SprA [bacterium]